MAFRSALPIIAVVIAGMTLSSCGGLRRALGMNKNTPDEFAVVNHGPLVMPPDYNLRPPAPTADRPQELPPAETARAALSGRAKIDAMRSGGMSRGEVGLLSKAGADQAGPDVRQQLEKESSAFASEQKSFTDRLLFWRDSKTVREEGVVLDPVAEQQRLSENKALGKKPTEGATPVITKGGGGGFLGVF